MLASIESDWRLDFQGGTASLLRASGMYPHRWIGPRGRYTPREVTAERPLREVLLGNVVEACTPSANGFEADRLGKVQHADEV